jgi:hypothetical protein
MILESIDQRPIECARALTQTYDLEALKENWRFKLDFFYFGLLETAKGPGTSRKDVGENSDGEYTSDFEGDDAHE